VTAGIDDGRDVVQRRLQVEAVIGVEAHLSKMHLSEIQAEMMKRHSGPAFGFVKLRLGVKRTRVNPYQLVHLVFLLEIFSLNVYWVSSLVFVFFLGFVSD
jgi:hypothetical protein